MRALGKKTVNVGYTDDWKSFANYSTGDNALSTYLKIAVQQIKEQASLLGAAQNQTSMRDVKLAVEPQVRSRHTLDLPASLFAGSYFDMYEPEVLNLAGLGFLLINELSKSVTDTWSYNSWSFASLSAFSSGRNCLAEQISKYQWSGRNVSCTGGVLDEAVARAGALRATYDLFAAKYNPTVRAMSRLALLPRRSPAATTQTTLMEGLTNEQLFFTYNAQQLCTVATPQWVVANQDSAPAKWRVNAAVANSKAFAKAFQCKAGTPMNRGAEACNMW